MAAIQASHAWSADNHVLIYPTATEVSCCSTVYPIQYYHYHCFKDYDYKVMFVCVLKVWHLKPNVLLSSLQIFIVPMLMSRRNCFIVFKKWLHLIAHGYYIFTIQIDLVYSSPKEPSHTTVFTFIWDLPRGKNHSSLVSFKDFIWYPWHTRRYWSLI